MTRDNDRVQFVLDPRLARAQSLRELAHSWYALSLACRRVGAMIERAAKEILYTPTSTSKSSETTNDNNSN